MTFLIPRVGRRVKRSEYEYAPKRNGLRIAVIKKASKLCAMLAICLFSWGCALKDSGPQVVTGATMGTSYRLALNCDLHLDLAKQVAESAFNGVDASMSTYRQDSELMRLNKSPIMAWQQVSEEFAEVIQAALEIGLESKGAFDPTIGALVRLWGFGGGEMPQTIPPSHEIDRLLAQSGLTQLEVTADQKMVRRHSDFLLDLSAIAKGYAVDRAIRALEAHGCHDLLLEVGGEVGVRGHRPDGTAWTVGIESPRRSSAVVRSLQLVNEAIATSGDYRNRVRIEGHVYSHTISPKTGRPVGHGLASVSVIASSVMRADALATALSVMGPEAGLAFARQRDLEAFFIVRTENGYDSFATGRFASF